jgi:hypothetical protein
MNEELENYIATHTGTERTKRSYRIAYKKLYSITEQNLSDVSEIEILNAIKQLSSNLNSQASYVNIAKCIRMYNGVSVCEIEKHRIRLKHKLVKKRNQGDENKLEGLATPRELQSYLNDLYMDENWRDYIINYLLINYSVRNKDVDCLIVNSTMDTKTHDNFLVVRKKDISYLRKNYKTHATYGDIKLTITSKKLRSAVEKYVLSLETDKENFFPLLLKENGERIGEDSLFLYITNKTLNNMTESDICKVNVASIDREGDLNKLQMLSATRGTSIQTLVSSYHLQSFKF